MPPVLSEDIVDCIAAFTPSVDDLLSMSATCTTWVTPCHRYAYRNHVLHVEEDSREWVYKHQAFVRSYPQSARFIQTLQICGNEEETFANVGIHDVILALSNLPNVSHLHISDVRWRAMNLPVPCPTFKTLRHLTMARVPFAGIHDEIMEPLQVMLLASEWTSVTISDAGVLTAEVQSMAPGPPIRALKIVDEEHRAERGLCALLSATHKLESFELSNYSAEDRYAVKNIFENNSTTITSFLLDISPNEPTNDSGGLFIDFIAVAKLVKSATLSLPLFSTTEAMFARTHTMFNRALCNRLLQDIVNLLPPVSRLSIHFTTLCCDGDGTEELERRMRLDWNAIGTILTRRRDIRLVQITLLSAFKVDKQPTWSIELLKLVLPHFLNFGGHYSIDNTLFLYVNAGDAEGLFAT